MKASFKENGTAGQALQKVPGFISGATQMPTVAFGSTLSSLASISTLDETLTNQVLQGGNDISSVVGKIFGSLEEPNYSDQIPPFHITITMVNEYGQAAYMRLLFVEILNQGMGMSIDDVTMEQSCTFVARSVEPLKPLSAANIGKLDSLDLGAGTT